ncbi:lipase family protein [Saccharopolyspora sp. NPDC002376]
MAQKAREQPTSPKSLAAHSRLADFGKTTALPAQRVERNSVGYSFDELSIKYPKSVLPQEYEEAVSFNFEPVYPDLKRTLLEADNTQPNAKIAHALAACSAYSYADEETLSIIMTRMGLERNRCHMVSQRVDAMLIDSTAFLVESDDGEVAILCYRGTQPFSILSWLPNITVEPRKVPLTVAGANGQFDVHAGFYRNIRATRHTVIESLIRALGRNGSVVKDPNRINGRAPKPLKALYITGHSLGGAMAALMTVMLLSQNKYAQIANKLKATYTFAQPMIGSSNFAEACRQDDRLNNSVFRYVYKHDWGPAVPPRACGSFAHFGTELKYDSDVWTRPSEPTRQISDLETLFLYRLFNPFLNSQIPFLGKLGNIFPFSLAQRMFPYSFQDHLPERYLMALALDETKNEFGDER